MIALIAQSIKSGADVATTGDGQAKTDRAIHLAQIANCFGNEFAAEDGQAMLAMLRPEAALIIPLTFIATVQMAAQRMTQGHAQPLPGRERQQIDGRRIPPETAFFKQRGEAKRQRKSIENRVIRTAALVQGEQQIIMAGRHAGAPVWGRKSAAREQALRNWAELSETLPV